MKGRHVILALAVPLASCEPPVEKRAELSETEVLSLIAEWRQVGQKCTESFDLKICTNRNKLYEKITDAGYCLQNEAAAPVSAVWDKCGAIAAPATTDALQFVSQHRWAIWGLSCNQGPYPISGTYDATYGRIMFRDNRKLQDDLKDNINFSISRDSDGDIIYRQVAFDTLPINVVVTAVVQKVKLIGDESLEIKESAYNLTDEAMMDQYLSESNPSDTPHNYKYEEKIIIAERCD